MQKPLLPTVALLLCAACTGYHVRKGDQAYARMAYAKAADHYARVVGHTRDRSLLVRAADSHRSQNELADALPLYERADSMTALTGDDALHLGEVLMGLGRRNEAAAHFMKVLDDRPEDRQALDLYSSCEGYKNFYEDSTHFIVNALNLPGVEHPFAGIPYRHGLLLAGEQEASGAKANPWNGMSFLDMYYSEKRTVVTWLPAVPLPGKVNGPFHEGPAVVSPDGRTLYFTRSNYYEGKLAKDGTSTSHLKLFRATLDSTGQWGDVRSFAYNSETCSIGHPALSADGKTLYFASDMPGGSGGSDIWRCRDNGTGWSAPENLGPTVNTPGNELFPTVNGDALYFSSTAHENMGGLDIFSTSEQDGHWTEPRNLLYPINTPHDDMEFVLDSAGTSGYLSSDRGGHDAIYTFWVNEPTFFVEGVVTDDSSRYLPNVAITLTEMSTHEDTTVMTGPDGKFRFPIKPNSDYKLRAEREDLISQTRKLSTKGLTRSDTLRADFGMTTIQLDQPIAVNNIYYDYDKWDIRPDAAAELDKLARIFKDNPQLSFELSSHTDSRGGDTYNLVLSDARANSAVNYLIQQGVDPDRIVGRGYGETRLVNRCGNGVKCTEEEHQANRRTEFRVVGYSQAGTH